MSRVTKPDNPYELINQELFWSRVSKSEPDKCWLWKRGTFTFGYGQFHLKRWPMTAHRVAWMIANKCNVPEGMCVCHACDNPRCCNPSHLWLGTHADNANDTRQKQRHRGPAGESNSNSKLTDGIVREIRQEQSGGIANVKLARRYKVCPSLISMIVNRKMWTHV